jgi:hypothetical protein
MDGTVKRFFDTLANRATARTRPEFDQLHVFVIDSAGTRSVRSRGHVSVNRRPGRGVPFSASEKVFKRIVDGEQNPLTAY